MVRLHIDEVGDESRTKFTSIRFRQLRVIIVVIASRSIYFRSVFVTTKTSCRLLLKSWKILDAKLVWSYVIWVSIHFRLVIVIIESYSFHIRDDRFMFDLISNCIRYETKSTATRKKNLVYENKSTNAAPGVNCVLFFSRVSKVRRKWIGVFESVSKLNRKWIESESKWVVNDRSPIEVETKLSIMSRKCIENKSNITKTIRKWVEKKFDHVTMDYKSDGFKVGRHSLTDH